MLFLVADFSGNTHLSAPNMKTLLLTSIFLLKFTLSFSQLSFEGVEGLKDTSNFPELRDKIIFQTFFIKVDSNDVPLLHRYRQLLITSHEI